MMTIDNEQEIVNLLNSQVPDDRLLGVIILGRMGYEKALEFIIEGHRSSYYSKETIALSEIHSSYTGQYYKIGDCYLYLADSGLTIRNRDNLVAGNIINTDYDTED